MKKLGYREMLRDRCPKIVSYALKWQKAKEKWIDHVYCYFIKMIGDEIDINDKIIRSTSENKRAVTTILLGLKKGKPINFVFDNTINWDDLSNEEKPNEEYTENDAGYWKLVCTWVNWFRTNYAYIENAYNISKLIGKDEEDIKIEIIQKYLMNLMPDSNASDEEKEAKYQYIDNLVNFLIGCFEGKY